MDLGFVIGSDQVLNKNWVTYFHGNEGRLGKSIGFENIIFCSVGSGSMSGAVARVAGQQKNDLRNPAEPGP